MLVHKGGQINNVQLITGLRIAEMSQRQKKDGNRGKKVRGGGGGGQGICEWRSEAFVKIQKKKKIFYIYEPRSVKTGLKDI